MSACKNCIHFYKATIDVPGTEIQQKTWINKADPSDPEAPLLDIARCVNEATAMGDITRDPSTFWFFDPEGNFLTIIDESIVVAGENDLCPNFEAIP